MIKTENASTEADSYDKFIGDEVKLPNRGDLILMAKVKRKVKSDDRNDTSFYNPLRDHSINEIEFPDGIILFKPFVESSLYKSRKYSQNLRNSRK